MFIYLSIMNCFQQLNLKFPPSHAVIALIMAVCACLCICQQISNSLSFLPNLPPFKEKKWSI